MLGSEFRVQESMVKLLKTARNHNTRVLDAEMVFRLEVYAGNPTQNPEANMPMP